MIQNDNCAHIRVVWARWPGLNLRHYYTNCTRTLVGTFFCFRRDPKFYLGELQSSSATKSRVRHFPTRRLKTQTLSLVKPAHMEAFGTETSICRFDVSASCTSSRILKFKFSVIYVIKF